MAPDKAEEPLPAIPLSEEDNMPEELRDCLRKACTVWLSNTQVLALIEGARECGLPLCEQPPLQPPGES